MQTVDLKGILGEVQELNNDNLMSSLFDKNIDHVDVFRGKKEIERRKILEGQHVSKLNLSPSKGFKKAPSIDGNRSRKNR